MSERSERIIDTARSELGRATIAAYFEALNTDRFEELRAVFAPDIVIAMGGSAPRCGVDDAIAYYPRALAALPVHRDDPVAVLMGDDGLTVSVEIAFTGRTTDDRPVAFTAVDLFDLDAVGRVVRLRSFYDTDHVARQLGPPG